MENEERTKFCKFCGTKIPEDAVICTVCGRQIESIVQESAPAPQVVINNSNNNSNINTNFNGGIGRKLCNKWVSFFLCLFLGILGAHKFYEGKAGMGILYLFTGGLFCIGWLIDLISILFKPNPYLV